MAPVVGPPAGASSSHGGNEEAEPGRWASMAKQIWRGASMWKQIRRGASMWKKVRPMSVMWKQIRWR